MEITKRDIQILVYVLLYYLVTARHIKDAFFPEAKDSSAARKRLGKLVHHGWEAAHCELPAWSGSVSFAPGKLNANGPSFGSTPR